MTVDVIIQETLSTHPIVLYMKGTPDFPQCGFSSRVVQILREFNATYHSVNVLEAPEIREGIKVFSNWPTIPQLYIKGEFIGGCDIVNELYENDELASILAV